MIKMLCGSLLISRYLPSKTALMKNFITFNFFSFYIKLKTSMTFTRYVDYT